MTAKIQGKPLLKRDYSGMSHCCTFLEGCVWVCPGSFWSLKESCCRLWCRRCCSCWWHRALRRAVWLAAKVLSLQLGISLKPLQNSRLTLLYCRHKQSAELTATGNQQLRGWDVRMFWGKGEGQNCLDGGKIKTFAPLCIADISVCYANSTHF